MEMLKSQFLSPYSLLLHYNAQYLCNPYGTFWLQSLWIEIEAIFLSFQYHTFAVAFLHSSALSPSGYVHVSKLSPQLEFKYLKCFLLCPEVGILQFKSANYKSVNCGPTNI